MQMKEFFTASNGRVAHLYTLRNASGFEVSITDMGGALVSILTPGRNGEMVDVLLGFQDPAMYEKNPPFFGALVGRVANRIKNGRFTLDGKTYQLILNDSNNRPNTLHGAKCYGRRFWDAEIIDDQTLKLLLVSPDGDAGFPGEVKIEVIYHITADNALEINYNAVTDAPTVVNLTNHAYFNLNGEFAGEYNDHEVRSCAYARTEVDAMLSPTGRSLPVDGTIFDLRKGRRFEEIRNELENAFDDNFIVAEKAGTFREDVFHVVSHRTGVSLSVSTTEPGVQFYMGCALAGQEIGKNGKGYPQFGAFCLEAQLWPDAPNHPEFPSARLNPGEVYTQKTVYKFGVEK